MTDKEKIRVEIERLLNKEWKWGSSTEAKYRCEAYRELLEFINTLPEELVSEDLEEEIDRYTDKSDNYLEYGYEWDVKTKTLKKLIEPKFKVGDRITNGKASITIGYIDDEYYYEIGKNIATRLFIKNQDDWKLVEQVKPKFEVGNEVEKEKSDFVGDGFIRCFADFLDFREGETYWLEYIGDDKYNVRSDNLLGKTYHITPCQLYTIFKKLTWLEKQGEKPQGKSALEAIQEEKDNNQNCVKPTTDKVVPKFKVGDRIRHKTDKWLANRTIKHYDKNIGYYTTINDWIRIEDQDNYELVPNKFDINTLEPLESRVLVRDVDHLEWKGAIFERYDGKKFYTIGELGWNYCIPYEDNEHLLGTTNDCDEYCKTWE